MYQISVSVHLIILLLFVVKEVIKLTLKTLNYIIGYPLECNNNEARLVNEGVTFLPDGNSYVSGYLQLCVNNRWTPVCNDGSLTDILANIACQDIDYQLTSKLSIISSVSVSLFLRWYISIK